MGSGGGGRGSWPQGPTHESEMVRAGGEAVHDWSAVSWLLVSPAVEA